MSRSIRSGSGRRTMVVVLLGALVAPQLAATHAVAAEKRVVVSNEPNVRVVNSAEAPVIVEQVPAETPFQQFVIVVSSPTQSERCAAVEVSRDAMLRIDAIHIEARRLGPAGKPDAYLRVAHATATETQFVRFVEAPFTQTKSSGSAWSTVYHGPLFVRSAGALGDSASICVDAGNEARAIVTGYLV